MAVSVALSVSVTSWIMLGSLRATVEAKTKVFVGSDVQLHVGPDTEVPQGFPLPATVASRVREAGYLSDGRQFDLLAVDPTTFASAAYWSGSFSERSLPDLLGLLDGQGSRALPVIVSNGGAQVPGSLEMEQQPIPIDVVAGTSSFPGSSSDRPLVVVAYGPLEDAFAGRPDPLHVVGATREMWIRGPAGAATTAAARAGITSYQTITADEVQDIPFVHATIDTYLVLSVIGVVALSLALVVAIVYLQARERRRIVASGLSRRMGLGPAMMRRSLSIELGTVLLGGLAVGGVAAVIGAARSCRTWTRSRRSLQRRSG